MGLNRGPVNQSENQQVLNIVQAMLGNISWNVRAVSLVCNNEASVVLHFVLAEDQPEDREEIEDIGFEFEALQFSRIDVDVVVTVNAGPLIDGDTPGRIVYLRKES
ncbi:hypothetical protein [Leptospira weilii]|uniref:hypothetical protein n=1 Tax=Leptospira weilii TaxID=28184 RepID=UPI000B1410DC|nr:hypothetical protein [Leptospira weilii]